MTLVTKALILSLTSLVLSACSGGGSLSLDSTSRKVVTKGSPFVSVNQGGRALVVEQGKTASTGVHGWVAVQSVAQGTLTSANGVSVTINKANGITQRGPANE